MVLDSIIQVHLARVVLLDALSVNHLLIVQHVVVGSMNILVAAKIHVLRVPTLMSVAENVLLVIKIVPLVLPTQITVKNVKEDL